MSGRRRGFTLVELMVALVIAAATVLMAHVALSTVMEGRDRSADHGQAILSAAARRSAVEHWIAMAMVVPDAPAFQGRRIRQGGLPLDELVFITADARPLAPGPHRVRLRVDTDPGSPVRGLVAELSPRTVSGFGPRRVVQLEPGAAGLEARYLVSVDGRPRWVEGWTSQDALPRAVALRLVDGSTIRLGEDGPSDLDPLLALPLTVPVLLESL